jgi:hypothetical protein
MTKTLRSRLSYANVMATLGVFIALGGSSYAALKVTGRNVPDGSLSGKDLKNNSVKSADVSGLTRRDFRRGELTVAPQILKGDPGPAGPEGAAGPQGLAGEQGAQGEPGPLIQPEDWQAAPSVRASDIGGFYGCTWVNYGAPHNAAAFYKDPWGTVHLKGLVRADLGTDEGCDSYISARRVFALPSGYRPAAQELHAVIANSQMHRIDVKANGDVVLATSSAVTAAQTWLSLDGIAFRAA